jgi:hypothetical protein
MGFFNKKETLARTQARTTFSTPNDKLIDSLQFSP